MPDKGMIRLRTNQREALRKIIATGERPARVILRAHILLRSANGWTDEAIAQAFETSVDTVRRTRHRCLARGVLACLSDDPRAGAPQKLEEEEEARVVALACSDPPAGRCRWTVRLLAEEAIGRDLIQPVVPETVRQVLQKTQLSRGKSKAGAMPRSRPSSWRA
jgi:putative transposase